MSNVGCQIFSGGHVFGTECLEVLLKPKSDSGWDESTCPLSSQGIDGIEEAVVEDDGRAA